MLQLTYFKDGRKSFGDPAAIASRSKMQPVDWWVMYGYRASSLRNIAIKILSQTASSSACERNWSTFALIHTKQRNRLAYKNIEKLVFCSYNMKLKIRDMAADRSGEETNQMDFTDIFESPLETSIGIENPIFPWVTSAHLDDAEGNPDPRVAEYARECGINVEQVLEEEVKVSSSSDDNENSSSSTGDDSGGVDGGGRYGEGTFSLHPSPPLYPSTTTGQHFNPTEDRYRENEYGGQESLRRQQLDDKSLTTAFSSMSMDTQHNSSSNLQSQKGMQPDSSFLNSQPWSGSGSDYNVPYYGHYGSYDIFGYTSSLHQNQPAWVDPNYPIYGSVGRDEATYKWHIRNYLHYYASTYSWQSYCESQDNNSFEEPRNSFWY